MAKLFIGTSGYSYNHWRNGVFYPPGLPNYRWLEFYCRHFNTVELNVTFYRVPQESTFKGWRTRTPDDFSFTLKAPRVITHLKRLKSVDAELTSFFDRASILGNKLAAVLWQLPPKWPVDLNLLKSFVQLLPAQYKHVFEFRDISWICPEVTNILRSRNIALCFADWPFKVEPQVSASFVYLRRHGPHGAYRSSYTDDELSNDASQIKAWLMNGLDVYVYFNNDAHGYAVANALTLKNKLL